ncbi:hypothetical protein FRB99_001881 [Tulasnella sp. 403]|nr:hypothetical protein FRB99_001881 [Tulasnella sp. 403]
MFGAGRLVATTERGAVTIGTKVVPEAENAVQGVGHAVQNAAGEVQHAAQNAAEEVQQIAQNAVGGVQQAAPGGLASGGGPAGHRWDSLSEQDQEWRDRLHKAWNAGRAKNMNDQLNYMGLQN